MEGIAKNLEIDTGIRREGYWNVGRNVGDN